MAVRRRGVLVALVVTLRRTPTASATARSQLQAHSYDVMILARTLSGTIARAEASLGRYVISGDKQHRPRLFRRMAAGAATRSTGSTSSPPTIPSSSARSTGCAPPIDARGEELSLTALSTSYKQEPPGACALLRGAANRRRCARSTRLLDAIIAARARAARRRAPPRRWRSVERSSCDRAACCRSSASLIVLGAIVLGWLTIARDAASARPRAPRPKPSASARTNWRARSTRRRRARTARAGSQAAPGPEDGGGRPADRRDRA